MTGAISETPVIRIATIDDVTAITTLFDQTVRRVNSRDYSHAEVEVWASFAKDDSHWRRKIERLTFFLAELNQKLVGFSSIATDGYLDHMYVHHDHQRQGIATLLLRHVEDQAVASGNDEIFVHVSKTATPFFQKKGYVIKGNQVSEHKGIRFVNALMKKSMKPADT